MNLNEVLQQDAYKIINEQQKEHYEDDIIDMIETKMHIEAKRGELKLQINLEKAFHTTSTGGYSEPLQSFVNDYVMFEKPQHVKNVIKHFEDEGVNVYCTTVSSKYLVFSWGKIEKDTLIMDTRNMINNKQYVEPETKEEVYQSIINGVRENMSIMQSLANGERLNIAEYFHILVHNMQIFDWEGQVIEINDYLSIDNTGDFYLTYREDIHTMLDDLLIEDFIDYTGQIAQEMTQEVGEQEYENKHVISRYIYVPEEYANEYSLIVEDIIENYNILQNDALLDLKVDNNEDIDNIVQYVLSVAPLY